MGVLRAVQEGMFGLDDDINSLLKSWRLIQKADLLAETTVTPRLLMSMTAGATVGGFPGYLPSDTLPTVPQILGYDGAGRRTPANTQPVTIDWQPNTRYQVLGRGCHDPAAGARRHRWRSLRGLPSGEGARPDPHDQQLLLSAAPGGEGHARGAGLRMGGTAGSLHRPRRWQVARLSGALRRWPLDDADRSGEVHDRGAAVARGPLEPGAHPGYGPKDGDGRRRRPLRAGFHRWQRVPHRPAKAGEAARFFGHTGGNWGFRSNFEGHLAGGNGFIIMANSDDANPLVFQELPARIRAVYGWDR